MTAKKENAMPLPKDSYYPDIQQNIVQNWRGFISNLENSLDMLEKDIEEASQLSSACTSEWCEATEHVIDELKFLSGLYVAVRLSTGLCLWKI
jgi:hypothetical protein